MPKKKTFLFVSIAIVMVVVVLFYYIRTPLFFRHVSSVIQNKYGLIVHADSIVYKPLLRAKIINLNITDSSGVGFQFASKDIRIESKFAHTIKSEVEKIILNEPKIRIRIGDKKETDNDLSFIKNLPAVHMLSVKKGEFKIVFGGGLYELDFKGIDIDVKNFSPKNGGNATFTGIVNFVNKDSSGYAGQGSCKGSMNLTGLFPKPIGSGNLEISLNSGSLDASAIKDAKIYLAVNFEKERIAVSSIKASAANMILRGTSSGSKSDIVNPSLSTALMYEYKTKMFSVDRFSLDVPALGIFKGYYKGVMKDTYPWKAFIGADGIDFKTLFANLKPFIEKGFDKNWSIQGKGALKGEMEGAFKGGENLLTGKATLEFKKGGFSSADGKNAAQDINGVVTLKFAIPSEGRKNHLQIYSEINSGEYLFGKYYKNLAKEKSSLSVETDFLFSDTHRFDFRGTMNIFDTGKYVYSGSVKETDWILSYSADGITPDKILSIMFYDFFNENYPSLKNIMVAGTMSTEGRLRGKREGVSLHGYIQLNDISVIIPERSIAVKNVNLSLPFDLHYPLRLEPGIRSKNGELHIGSFEKGAFKLSDLKIPFLVTANNLLIPGEFVLPFYGGIIKIIECRAEDVLAPSRKFNFAAKIENVDISSILEELTGLQLPGHVEAHFPLIGYEDEKWITKGTTTVNVFGGTVHIENVQLSRILSRERRLKGDIEFYDIDLGKITDTIKIGKIKGVIKGSVKNLEIEYGQPSYFILDIDSVKKGGVDQMISVDAIENMSIIGTGSGAVGSILRSGINRFFKEYPYSRIGIKCTLENDNFRLRGKILEGGQEYFIRRSLLRGLDMINRDPSNSVSFEDMQERISRIFKKDGEKPTFTTSMN